MTPRGAVRWMYRKGQRVRFFDYRAFDAQQQRAA